MSCECLDSVQAIYIFSTMDANKEAHHSSCIRGYYIYNAIWCATVGEELQCAKKLGMPRTDMQSPFYEIQM